MELASELAQRPGTRVSSWCQAPQPLSPLPPGPPTVHFPYAVLEIKLADKHNKPEWVKELLATSLIVEATKFSKFQHGLALLYPTLLRNTPHWFVADCLSSHGDDRMSACSGSGQGSHEHDVQVFRPATLEEARHAFEAMKVGPPVHRGDTRTHSWLHRLRQAHAPLPCPALCNKPSPTLTPRLNARYLPCPPQAEKALHKLERSSRRSSSHNAATHDQAQPSASQAACPLPVSSPAGWPLEAGKQPAGAKWEGGSHVAINIERSSHSHSGAAVGRRNPAARLASLLRLASLSSRTRSKSSSKKGAAVDSKGNLLPVVRAHTRSDWLLGALWLLGVYL